MGIGQYYINIRPIFGFVAEPEHGLLGKSASAFSFGRGVVMCVQGTPHHPPPQIRHSLYFSHVVSVCRFAHPHSFAQYSLVAQRV